MKKMILAVSLLVIVAFGFYNISLEDDLELSGSKIAIVLAQEYNEKEASGAIDYLTQRGAVVKIIGIEYGSVTPYDKKSVSRDIDILISNANSSDFDALVIPGGYSSPVLAKNEAVLEFVRSINSQGKPIAAICLGPSVLAHAGVLEGVKATSHPNIERQLRRSGANWENSKVVKDDNIITSRRPRDQKYFNAELGLSIYEVLNSAN